MPKCLRRFLAALCALLAVLVLAGPAWASDASLLYDDDPTLMWTEWDLIRNGQAPPTSIYPITRAEFQKNYTRTLVSEPPTTRNMLGFTLRPVYGMACFPAVPISRNGETLSPVSNVMYWSMPPFLVLSDDLYVGNWFHMRIAVDQRLDAGKMVDPRAGGLSSYVLEANTPREGYLTVAGRDLAFTLGRLRSGIGHGFFGNTFLNGRANFYDQLQFNATAGDFKYFFMFGMSDPLLTPAEKAIQSPEEGWDSFPIFDEPYKSFAYHRIEYRPWPQLVLGVGEANVIGGHAPDLKNILPFNIWHNTYSNGYKNVMMVADVSAVPLKGLHLFGEFLIDDVRLGREGSSRKPTSLGWQVGARYVLPWGNDFRHMVGLEYTHIDPWTYNTFQPYLMFYQRQTYSSSVNDWYMDFPLGYAFGSDLDHYGVYYRTVSQHGVQAAVSYFHMVQGEVELGAYDSDEPWYEYNDLIPLTDGHVGIVEIYDTVSASVKVPLWWSISFTAQGSYSFVKNAGHVAGAADGIYTWLVGLEYQY